MWDADRKPTQLVFCFLSLLPSPLRVPIELIQLEHGLGKTATRGCIVQRSGRQTVVVTRLPLSYGALLLNCVTTDFFNLIVVDQSPWHSCIFSYPTNAEGRLDFGNDCRVGQMTNSGQLEHRPEQDIRI